MQQKLTCQITININVHAVVDKPLISKTEIANNQKTLAFLRIQLALSSKTDFLSSLKTEDLIFARGHISKMLTSDRRTESSWRGFPNLNSNQYYHVVVGTSCNLFFFLSVSRFMLDGFNCEVTLVLPCTKIANYKGNECQSATFSTCQIVGIATRKS